MEKRSKGLRSNIDGRFNVNQRSTKEKRSNGKRSNKAIKSS